MGVLLYLKKAKILFWRLFVGKEYYSEAMLLTKSDYVEELECWLEWHLNIVGIDHIVIFDNESTIDVKEVIKRFPDGKIDYSFVSGWPDQLNLYNKHIAKSKAKWILFIDDDEFLYIGDKYGGNIHGLLDSFQNNYHKNKLYVLWVNMFTKDYEEERKGLYLNTHTYYSYEACGRLAHKWGSDNGWGNCFMYLGENEEDRLFYRYSCCDGISSGHFPKCLNGDNTVLLQDGTVIKDEHLFNIGELNTDCFFAHYQYKSEKDWQNKCSRYCCVCNKIKYDKYRDIYQSMFDYKHTFVYCDLVKNRWEEYLANKNK